MNTGLFLVFAGDTYYPSGGWRDLFGYYPTKESAEVGALKASEYWEWVHIVHPDGSITDQKG